MLSECKARRGWKTLAKASRKTQQFHTVTNACTLARRCLWGGQRPSSAPYPSSHLLCEFKEIVSPLSLHSIYSTQRLSASHLQAAECGLQLLATVQSFEDHRSTDQHGLTVAVIFTEVPTECWWSPLQRQVANKITRAAYRCRNLVWVFASFPEGFFWLLWGKSSELLSRTTLSN